MVLCSGMMALCPLDLQHGGTSPGVSKRRPRKKCGFVEKGMDPHPLWIYGGNGG